MVPDTRLYFENTSSNLSHSGKEVLLIYLIDKNIKVSKSYITCEANKRLIQLLPNAEVHRLSIFPDGSIYPCR